MPRLSAAVLAAALALAGGLRNPTAAGFSANDLTDAQSEFKGGIGLQQFLLEAAKLNGYSGNSFRDNVGDVIAYALPSYQLSASSIDVSGILSNVANKFILEHFNAVEQVWRTIAAIRPVTDFKESTSYRLTGDLQYEQVGDDGKIKHGTLGETGYTNKAETYGKIIGLTRKDILNDDMGAFLAIMKMLGRGGALKLNDVFWREFLADHGTFFTSDYGNYITGVTVGTNDSRLGIEGLTRGEKAFLDQQDEDGNPLGNVPSVCLVPSGLSALAAQLMKSVELRDTSGNGPYGTGNPHAGKFTVASSAYLGNPNYGNDQLAWYLAGNPAALAAIEVVFLDGVEVPTIESAAANFDTLGIKFRGHHSFGAKKQDRRAIVKSKGAA